MKNKSTICHLAIDHKSDDPRIYVRMVQSLVTAGYFVIVIARAATLHHSTDFNLVAIPIFQGWLGKFKMLWILLQKVIENRADVYHFHDPEILILAPILCRYGHVIYDVHEDYTKSIIENRQGGHFSPLIAIIWKKAEVILARWCDAIVAATPHIAKKFSSHPKVVTVRNYVPIQEMEASTDYADDHKSFDLIYVGGIASERGIFNILDALALLPQATLILAGSFSRYEEEKKAKLHPAWPQVHFCGQVASQEIPSLLRSARVGLLLLWPLPRFTDSLPLKLFEYMAAGLPVISSQDTLYGQIIQDAKCGLCIEAQQPTEIAAAIQTLLASPEQYEKMADNARQAVLTTYNWNAEADTLITLYDSFS